MGILIWDGAEYKPISPAGFGGLSNIDKNIQHVYDWDGAKYRQLWPVGPNYFVNDDFSTRPNSRLDTWNSYPTWTRAYGGIIYASRNNTTHHSDAVYNTKAPSNDMAVEATIVNPSVSVDSVQTTILMLRTSNNVSGGPAVQVYVEFNPGNVSLRTHSPNGAWVRRRHSGWSANAGDVVRLQAEGDVYSVWKNDSLVFSWTDTINAVSPWVDVNHRSVGFTVNNWFSGGWFGSNYTSFGLTKYVAYTL